MNAAVQELVIASHNQGKIRELQELLRPFAVRVYSAGEMGVEEPEETEATFAGNAALKALASARATGKLALADDSGLAVEALAGAPGIYSARWAGPEKDFAHAMRRVQNELTETAGHAEGQPAAFICALCLAWPDGRTEIFEGRIDGTLTFPPRGQNGFGYDPIFIPEGGIQTFGEIEAAAKHAVSHRARAFAKLVAFWERALAA